MHEELKKIKSLLPKFFFSLVNDLQTQGFIPILVGGVVRDFFLNGKLGDDWDIELTHPTLSFEKGSWKDLGKDLRRYGKVTYLPYEVIRLEVSSYQLEFSPPRIENFHQNAKGHSNFSAEFDFQLPFEESVLRRDFTINAMGLRFSAQNELEFLDPCGGLFHLREKILHSVGDHFEKDPVRFLRAHRFSQSLNFSFSPELEKKLQLMSLEGMTPSYLWGEMKKTNNPVVFLSDLVEKKEIFSFPLEKNFREKVPLVTKVLKDPRNHLCWIIALEWVGLSSESWSRYFSLSSSLSQKLSRWARLCQGFKGLHPEEFQKDFDDLKNDSGFKNLFDWYFTTKQLLQKNPDLPLMEMIEEFLPNWIYLFRFDPPRDVKHIDPPYRAKYQVWNLCQRL